MSCLVHFEGVGVRSADGRQFMPFHWKWQPGEQWAILGPNGSGKSLLAMAIAGWVPVPKGEIHYHFGNSDQSQDTAPENCITLLSPRVQRELMTHESSFYQSRWHSGIGEGQRTVAQFLSQASVEGLNPFEVAAPKVSTPEFRERRSQIAKWLGIEALLRRKLICLSNGEQRKVLLAHALLCAPRLLILDDPFGGLDVRTRSRLKTVIRRLVQSGLPILLVTNRPDEIPDATTHVLLVDGHRVIAQGPSKKMLSHSLARKLAAEIEGPSALVRSAGWSRNQVAIQSNNRRRNQRTSARLEQPLVSFNHVTVQHGRTRILNDITWTMFRGQNWALLGPNGSGKTTLLSLIQADNPQAYALDIRLFGARVHSTQRLWQCRQRMGWVSPELHQHYPRSWACIDVVCSGFHHTLGLYHACASRRRVLAKKWLKQFQLSEVEDIPFGELSLGDQRLVLIARAIVKRPALLILDEPCQGLDALHRRRVLRVIDQVVAQTGAGLIFVTHHEHEMPNCITHLLHLERGKIIASSGRGVAY